MKNKNGKEGKILNIIRRINVKDAYNFIHSNNKYSRQKSKNTILSRMRKFVRILNCEENLDFKDKIIIPNKNKIENKNYYKELIKIINHTKESSKPQLLLIFYFLYFSGLNYSTLARITLKDFKKGFNTLTLKKRKIMKYFIPDVIKNKLSEYFINKNNKSIFFFYDSYHDSNSYTITKLIKNNIRIILESTNGVSVKYLLSLFF